MATAHIDETGLHLPTYAEILEDLKQQFRNIYGQDIYLEADSQDGALCAVFALHIHDCYSLAASVYNAYSPQSAQGTGLSSVVKTNGIRRQSSSRSQVDLRLVGQAGTIIRNGVATDAASLRWLLPATVVIPLSGEITVTAQAETPGEIRAAAGEISTIATPTRGWQTVSNPGAARPGQAVETDAQLRQRQAISTALPSLSIFDGTYGAIAQLPGVIRSRGYENDTSEPDANGLPPHSISFVVDGGDTQAIADTLNLKKGPGCGTFGDVAVLCRDQYGVPNIINFFRPVIRQVAASVTIQPLTGYLSSTGETIRANVLAYLNSLRIGDNVLLSKLYSPINAAEPVAGQRTFDVIDLQLGFAGGALGRDNLPILFNEAVSALADEIQVTVL